ncbi:glycosyl hydrolase family 32 [Bacteroidota bacterium]
MKYHLLIISGILLLCACKSIHEEHRILVKAGEFKKIYDPGIGEEEKWYINDHCFIYGSDSKWHLFGITHEEPAKPLDEDNLAHATAVTLLQKQWTKNPFALSIAPDEPWNEFHLWAPHVIFYDSVYYMYYCAGGEQHTKYKIHLATSKDLWTWKRHDKNPMVVDGFDARDPFIMRLEDKWVMYYTATSSPDSGNHIVAYVMSYDLVTWNSRGVAFIDSSRGTYGGPTESPFIVQRGEKYYLFIGPRGGYDGTDVFLSDDPLNWNAENKVGHIESHAAEVARDLNGNWYVSRCGWGRGGVYLAPLTWNDKQENPKTNISIPGKTDLNE